MPRPVSSCDPQTHPNSDCSTMLLLIDNYDSFTYNLFHYLGELGARTRVERNDEITVRTRWPCAPRGSCSRPAPATPNGPASACPDQGRRGPGAPARRLPRPSGDRPGLRRQGRSRARPMHGKLSAHRPRRDRRLRRHAERRSTRRATTRWSPSAHPARLPRGQRRDRRRHHHGPAAIATLPIHGVQFHPESIATKLGHACWRISWRLAAAGGHA